MLRQILRRDCAVADRRRTVGLYRLERALLVHVILDGAALGRDGLRLLFIDGLAVFELLQ